MMIRFFTPIMFAGIPRLSDLLTHCIALSLCFISFLRLQQVKILSLFPKQILQHRVRIAAHSAAALLHLIFAANGAAVEFENAVIYTAACGIVVHNTVVFGSNEFPGMVVGSFNLHSILSFYKMFQRQVYLIASSLTLLLSTHQYLILYLAIP